MANFILLHFVQATDIPLAEEPYHYIPLIWVWQKNSYLVFTFVRPPISRTQHTIDAPYHYLLFGGIIYILKVQVLSSFISSK
jgi:hypothetical protein